MQDKHYEKRYEQQRAYMARCGRGVRPSAEGPILMASLRNTSGPTTDICCRLWSSVEATRYVQDFGFDQSAPPTRIGDDRFRRRGGVRTRWGAAPAGLRCRTKDLTVLKSPDFMCLKHADRAGPGTCFRLGRQYRSWVGSRVLRRKQPTQRVTFLIDPIDDPEFSDQLMARCPRWR